MAPNVESEYTPAAASVPADEASTPATPAPAHEDAAAASTFLTRVSGFPLVSTTIQSAISIYGDSKKRFGVIDSLEASVRERVLPQVQPIVSQGLQSLHAYDAQLAKLDRYACSGLDALETRLPIIREPTEAVLASSKRLVDDSVQSVRTKVARSLEEGKQLLSTNVDTALRLSEAAVDRFLPAAAAAAAAAPADDALLDGTTAAPALALAAAAAPPAAAADEDKAETTPYGRAQRLGYTLQERITTRALAGLHATTAATPRSSELVNRALEQVNAQLQSMRAALAQAQASVAPVQTSVQASLAQAAVPLRAASTKFVGSLHATTAAVAAAVPPKVRADTEHLRQALAVRITDLRANAHLVTDHAWSKQVLELADSGVAYLATVRLQLGTFYLAHAPAALQFTRPAAVAAPLELEDFVKQDAPHVEAH